jgi:hypothetical protein
MFRGKGHMSTPMPGIGWETCFPLKDLVPIESEVGPSQDKGKGKEQAEMDEGKPEKAQFPSLTVSEYEGVFHNGDSAFVYNWIVNNHGDSFSDRDIKETE